MKSVLRAAVSSTSHASHTRVQKARFAAQRLVNYPRAAALIIGDEILSGKTKDSNSSYLAKSLFNHGIHLCRIETITDDVEDIVSSVRRLSELVGSSGCVFTSGGIGCTHDDVTYQAIASAFDCSLSLHQPTVHAMTQFYERKNVSFKQDDIKLRMATLPTPCRIITTPNLWVPLVVVENVYILPGVPSLFEKMMDSALNVIERGKTIVRKTIDIDCGEGDIAERLCELQKEFPDIAIGSYPRMSNAESCVFVYRTQLCFSGRHEAMIDEARDIMCKHISSLSTPFKYQIDS